MIDHNLQVIRESFGRVVYTHKTHEKEAEIQTCNSNLVKYLNVVITALTTGGLITSLLWNNQCVVIATAILSTLSLAFTIYQLSFDPTSSAEKHKNTARELWLIREKYLNLQADILSNALPQQEAIHQRDRLASDLSAIYKYAPITSSKSYQKAREALQINEEFTFKDSEIDQFLPSKLRTGQSTK